MPALRFRLLGQATVTDERGEPLRISATKGLAILSYLAMHPHRPIRRTELANLLWGDRPDAQARQNLRQAIFTLRRDLGPDLAPVVSVDEQAVALAAGAISVDAVEFAACATSSDDARQRCLDLPWGPFLHDFSTGAELFDDWVAGERSRLDTLATRAFSELAERADSAGDGERAILALERLVAIDPTEEERHRRLLSLDAHYRGVDAALARGKHLASVLKRELDVEPQPATLSLLEELRRSAQAVRPGARTPLPPRPAVAAAESGPIRPAPSRRPLMIATAVVATTLAGSAVIALRDPGPPAPAGVATLPSGRLIGDPGWLSPGTVASSTDGQVGRLGGVVAIAILPFASLGDQAEQAGLLAAMVTDDLTDVLSRAGTFRVISRQTAATYAAQKIDAAAIGAELGIRYLLEGSVSTRGDLIRVNVSLTEAPSRAHLWSARFERAGADRHALQDDIINALARELQIEIGTIESETGSTEPDVHALVFKGWRAIDAAGRGGVASLHEAEGHFRRALEREPGNLRAQHGLAAFHTHMAVQLYAADPASHIAAALAILQPLLDRNPSSAAAHATMGLLQVAKRRFADAEKSFRSTIALNPSHAGAYAQIGRSLLRRGRPQEGLDHVRYAMRLSPRDPLLSYWLGFAGAAELELANYATAIELIDRSLGINPAQPRVMLVRVAAQALAGNMPEARSTLAQLQAKLPHLSNDRLVERFGRPAPESRFLQGLELALAQAPDAP